MPTYLILGQFTEQGIKNVQNTVQRADKFKETAREHGVHIREVLWIMGNYDICAIAEAADDQTACSLLLKVGAWGNVRSTTYRAFDREEMVNMVKRLE